MKKRTKIMLWGLAFFGPVWWLAPIGLRSGRVTVSESTTRITSPLKADGMPDYAAYLNAKYGEGVTVENNAAALLVDVWDGTLETHYFEKKEGPSESLDDARRRWSELRQRLGAGARPAGLPTFTDFGTWIQRREIKDIQEERLRTAQDRMQAAYETEFNECGRMPWTAKQHPDAAVWMAEQKPLLEIMRQASVRPYFFVPQKMGAPLGQYDIMWLGGNKRAAGLFSWHAMQCAGEGRFEEALDSVQVIYRLGSLQAKGGMRLIDILVAQSIQGMADQTLVDLAQAVPKDHPAWEKLGQMAAEPDMDFYSVCQQRMDQAERWSALEMVLQLPANKNMDAFNAPMAVQPLSMFADMDVALARLNDYFDRLAVDQWSEADVKQLRHSVIRDFYCIPLVPPGFRNRYAGRAIADFLAGTVMPTGHAYANINKIHISHLHLPLALTLSKYRQDHHRYPATLADLVPKYIPSLPEAKHDFGSVAYRTAGQGKAFTIGYVKPDDLERYEKTGHGLREFFTSPGYEALQEADEKAEEQAEENAKANGE